jgi:hypothetical protein
MGHSQSLSHTNLNAMSKITQVKSADILKVLQTYLEDMEWDREHPNGQDSDYDSDDSVESGKRDYGRRGIPKGQPLAPAGLLTEEEMEGDNVEYVCRNYPVHPDHLREICVFHKMFPSDIDVICDIYTTMDHKGLDNVSIRDVFCAYAPVCAESMEDCIRTTCTIFDLDDTSTVGYGVLIHIFSLVMDGIEFFGDKVYTSSTGL